MSFNLPICSSLFHPKANFQAENVKARQVFQATIEVSIKLIIATSPTTLFLHSLLKLSRLSIIVHGWKSEFFLDAETEGKVGGGGEEEVCVYPPSCQEKKINKTLSWQSCKHQYRTHLPSPPLPSPFPSSSLKENSTEFAACNSSAKSLYWVLKKKKPGILPSDLYTRCLFREGTWKLLLHSLHKNVWSHHQKTLCGDKRLELSLISKSQRCYILDLIGKRADREGLRD